MSLVAPHRTISWLPLVLLLFYLFVSIGVFIFGPFHYPVPNWTGLIAFFALALGCILAGYYFSTQARTVGAPRMPLRFMIATGGILSCLILFPSVYIYTGKLPWDIVSTLCDQGAAFYELQARLATLSESTRAPVVLVRALSYPFIFAVLPLGVFFWGRLSWLLRLFVFLTVFASLTFSVFRGTDREIFDLVVVGASALAAVFCRTWLKRGMAATIFSRDVLTVTICLVLFVGAALLLFAERKMQRSYQGETSIEAGCFSKGLFGGGGLSTPANGGSDAVSGQPLGARALCVGDLQLCANYSGPIMSALGPYATAAALAASYLGQGYFGLSLSLDKTFQPTWGLGHSPVLMRIYELVTGDLSLYQGSYTYRLREDGWSDAHQWSTIFTWLANDVGFLGAALVGGIIALLWGVAWRDAVYSENGSAVVMFAFLSQLFLYVPANNQLALSLESYVGVSVWLIVWLAGRANLLSRFGEARPRGQAPRK